MGEAKKRKDNLTSKISKIVKNFKGNVYSSCNKIRTFYLITSSFLIT